MLPVRHFQWAWVFLVIGLMSVACGADSSSTTQSSDVTNAPTEIKITRFYIPGYPDDPTTRRLIQLMREEPSIRIKEWGGLSLPGGAGRAPIMMGIAGRSAPDIMESWFHIINNDINQSFLYPLNEWIGEDRNGNGQIDDDEAIWDRWKDVPLQWRRVATRNGKVYGIPQPFTYNMGVIYRTDLVRAAGLDPLSPPQTWDELIYWCQKLTDPNKDIPGSVIKSGQRGIVLMPHGFFWLPWMQSAGGDPITQVRISPKTGIEHIFPMEAVAFITPEGEDLSNVDPVWRANFASPQGIEAMGFFHRLRWMKWLIDPQTKDPVNLTAEDVINGTVKVGNREIAFTPEEVITGVARGDTGQRGTGSGELFVRGEVAMMPALVQDLASAGGSIGLNPELLSWFPFPAGPGPKGQRVVQIQRHFAVMTEGVSRRPKAERDKIWKALTSITEDAVRDNGVRKQVLSGMANFANPNDLKRLGLDDYLRDVPMDVRRNYQQIDEGAIRTFTEPFMGFWVTMDMALKTHCISLVIAETGEHFDYATALKKIETQANSGLMFGRTEKELAQYRPWALAIFSGMAFVLVVFAALIIRSFLKTGNKQSSATAVGYSIAPWLMIGPALILIGLWSYYPLSRGIIMAFQDYKIVGDSKFVGLDNFIGMALDQSFWVSMLRTLQFVVLNVALAFCTPIVLALLLSEVPRGKVLYRTLFFLPQVTSGLVITLIWKLLYDPTPQGLLNQMIKLLSWLPLIHIGPQTWLQDPRLAMLCCIIPTVWASMGASSLIYLAALKGVPEESYEAVEVDGGGMRTKLTAITLPTLMPLIIINFVGVFIATFQNMGNIFLLTFGGPGDATNVIALKIWVEAYNNLRFGMATTMAWVLGSTLIGFTYLQVRMLRRVEFRKANWD
jgi:multiple sugar transport system permease protein